jgi:hypothetical protein
MVKSFHFRIDSELNTLSSFLGPPPLSHPNEEPQWMKGPLNVDILSLIITSDPKGQKKILIQYDLFGIKHKLIDPIPIEKLIVK